MNASQLVSMVALETGVPENKVALVFNSVTKNIIKGVAVDGKVSITNFGTFKKVVAKERECYNPVLKKKMIVSSKVKMKFIPSEYAKGNI